MSFPDPKKIQQEVSPELILTPEVIEGARSTIQLQIRQARKANKNRFVIWYAQFRNDPRLLNMMFAELEQQGHYVEIPDGSKGRTVYFQKPDIVVRLEGYEKIEQADRERHAAKVVAAGKRNDAQTGGCLTGVGVGALTMLLTGNLISVLLG